MRRTRGLPFDPAEWRARAVHSGERSGEERQRAARLAAVFAEEDAEISARIGEDITVEYKFTCRFCGSKFSLAQQLEAHERECGTVAPTEEESMAETAGRVIVCKSCGHRSPTLKDHSAHLLCVHREETLARRKQLAVDRKAAKQGAASVNPPPADRPRPHPAHPACAQRSTAAAADPGGNGHHCPLCGGPVPQTTAALVTALQAEGLDEMKAFAAARVARRILAAPVAA